MTGRKSGGRPRVIRSRRRARRVAAGWIGVVVLASLVDPAAVFDVLGTLANTRAGAGPGGPNWAVRIGLPVSLDVFAVSHCVAYGVLAWLVAEGVDPGPELDRDTERGTAAAHLGPATAGGTAVIAVAVAAAAGLGVELLQAPLAARTASAADAGLNAVGAAAGVVARALLHRARR